MENKWAYVFRNNKTVLINQNGNVLSRQNGFPVQMDGEMKDGVKTVMLRVDGEDKPFSVANLVARHFLPNPYYCREVEFIDGNPENCIASNLRWVENTNDTSSPDEQNQTESNYKSDSGAAQQEALSFEYTAFNLPETELDNLNTPELPSEVIESSKSKGNNILTSRGANNPNDFFNAPIPPTKKTFTKKRVRISTSENILQYSLDKNGKPNKFLKGFDSIESASVAIGKSIKGAGKIRKCCMGSTASAFGFFWKFANENVRNTYL